MCRLLGWAARSPVPLAGLLDPRELRQFTALSRKHRDGWGAAWHTGSGIGVRKNPDAAHGSRDFGAWATHVPADLGMVHLRWATLGLGVHRGNTHPFAAEGIAFAHNGSIRPPSSLDELVSPALRRGMEGETDSERYFRAVLSRAAGPDGRVDPARIEPALLQTVDAIAATKDFTSLNCLLITPERLYAVCRFRGTHAGEGPDYFHLRYRLGEDVVVVSSTGWGEGWRPLADGELLTVDRQTLALSVTRLDEALVGS
jgi:predicted glutamine amidotransferase